MDIALIEKNVENIVAPIVEEMGYDYIATEFVEEEGDWYLRVYIDKEGGINIDDCALVSRPLSDKLDEEDPIDESYFFEVSSSGLSRPLKKESDFEKFKNNNIKIILLNEPEGKDIILGILRGLENDEIIIEKNKKIININRKSIKAVYLNEL
jgi:ribosome maturation factor RimP